MSELADWLHGQIVEDRERAEQWPDILGECPASPDGFWRDIDGHVIYEPRPERLAQCEAHQAIVNAHSGHDCQTLRSVGLAYQRRPGYRDDWRPWQLSEVPGT
jgi:hypothetical protein